LLRLLEHSQNDIAHRVGQQVGHILHLSSACLAPCAEPDVAGKLSLAASLHAAIGKADASAPANAPFPTSARNARRRRSSCPNRARSTASSGAVDQLFLGRRCVLRLRHDDLRHRANATSVPSVARGNRRRNAAGRLLPRSRRARYFVTGMSGTRSQHERGRPLNRVLGAYLPSQEHRRPIVISVSFVGTGEAFDAELPNTSVLFRGSQTWLLDCGYAVPHALWRISQDPNLIDAVYLSHTHADHTFGLPALLLRMREDGRSRPLRIVAEPGLRARLSSVLELAYPGSFAPDKGFELEWVELVAGSATDVGGLAVRTARSAHSVPNMSIRIEDQAKVLCFSGDGAPSTATLELYSGCDLLVHECYFAAEPRKGHAAALPLLRAAVERNISTLCLVHLGRHEKVAIHAAVAGVTTPRVLIPTPGDELRLM
jgi:ribonuclease Z